MERYFDCSLHEVGNDYDDWYGEYLTSHDGNMLYSVRNLTDCPEDAVIWRDLFSCSNYIDAINFGIKLGREGYTQARIIGEPIKEEDWE